MASKKKKPAKKKQQPPKHDVDAFLESKKEEVTMQDSETVRELRLQIGKLERKAQKRRSSEAIILDAIDDVLRDGLPVLKVPRVPKSLGVGNNEETAILHLSDTQIGKVTETYDTQIAEARIMECARKTVTVTNVRRSFAKIKECHVYLGGDMIEGEAIFSHQAHLIDSSVYDQACVNGPKTIARAILYLLEHFELVKVYTVPGNHGRNGPRNTSAHPRTNWDNVLYHTLKVMLTGFPDSPRPELKGRLEYNMSERFWIVDRVYDWGNLLVHGHQITGGFAGFPWYGTAKKAWGWIDAIEDPWDNLFFGHFHTPAMATLNLRRFYANGTTESDNEFAQELLAAAGVPCQRLLFMNAAHGVISDDLLELGGGRVPSLRRSNG